MEIIHIDRTYFVGLNDCNSQTMKDLIKLLGELQPGDGQGQAFLEMNDIQSDGECNPDGEGLRPQNEENEDQSQGDETQGQGWNEGKEEFQDGGIDEYESEQKDRW